MLIFFQINCIANHTDISSIYCLSIFTGCGEKRKGSTSRQAEQTKKNNFFSLIFFHFLLSISIDWTRIVVIACNWTVFRQIIHDSFAPSYKGCVFKITQVINGMIDLIWAKHLAREVFNSLNYNWLTAMWNYYYKQFFLSFKQINRFEHFDWHLNSCKPAQCRYI